MRSEGYLRALQSEIDLTDAELEAILYVQRGGSALGSDQTAAANVLFGPLGALNVSGIEIQPIVSSFAAYEEIRKVLVDVNSAIVKIEEHFDYKFNYLIRSAPHQALKESLADLGNVTDGSTRQFFFEIWADNFVLGTNLVLTGVPTAFQFAQLTFLRPFQQSFDWAKKLVDVKTAFEVLDDNLNNQLLVARVEAALDVASKIGAIVEIFDALDFSDPGKSPLQALLSSSEMASLLHSATTFAQSFSPEQIGSDGQSADFLGASFGILSSTSKIIELTAGLEAVVQSYSGASTIGQEILTKATTILVADLFAEVLDVAAIVNAELPSSGNSTAKGVINLLLQLGGDLTEVASADEVGALNLMELLSSELVHLIRNSADAYDDFLDVFDVSIASRPEVLEFNQSQGKLSELLAMPTIEIADIDVARDLAADIPFALLEQVGLMLPIDAIVLFASSDANGYPKEVLFIAEDGRLSRFEHVRSDLANPDERYYSFEQELAVTDLERVEAIIATLQTQVALNESTTSTSFSFDFLTGDAGSGPANFTFDLDGSAPSPVSVDLPALKNVQADASAQGAVLREVITSASSPVGVNQNVVAPTIPEVVETSDVQFLGLVRSIDLDVGERAAANATPIAGLTEVVQVTLKNSGDLSLNLTHFGGPDVLVRVWRDFNLDNEGEATEILASSYLSQSGATAGVIDLSDASYGTYFVSYTSDLAGGAAAAVQTRLTMSELDQDPAPLPLLDQKLNVVKDQFSFTKPGSLDDDGYPQFARIDDAADIDPFQSNVLLAGRSYIVNAVPFERNGSPLEDLTLLVWDVFGVQIASVPLNASGLASYEIIVPDIAGQSGRYTFAVEGRNGAIGDFSISYRDAGAVLAPDDYADDQAFPAILNQDYSVFVAGADDVDKLLLSVQAGHTYTVWVTPGANGESPLTHSKLTVDIGSGFPIASRYVESANAFAVQFAAPTTGSAVIELASELGGSGQATIRLTDNGSFAGTLPLLSGALPMGSLDMQIAYDDPDYARFEMTNQAQAFTFSATPGSLIEIQFGEADNTFGSLAYALYDSFGRQIVLDYEFNAPGDGKLIGIRTPVEGDGAYTLVLSHDRAVSGSYTFEVAGVIVDDLADRPDDARILSLDTPSLLHIESGAYDDFVSLLGLSGAISISFASPDIPAGEEWDLASGVLVKLVTADGTLLATEAIVDITAETFNVTLPENQEVFLQVGKYGSSGAVEITATTLVDDLPNGQSTSTRIAPGETVSGLQESFGDEDAFAMTLYSGMSLDVTRSVDGGTLGGRLIRFVDIGSGEVLFESDQANFQWEVPDFGGLASIEALLVHDTTSVAAPNDSSFSIGGYSISVEDITSDDHGDIIANASALSVGESLRLSLETVNDVDVLSLGHWDMNVAGRISFIPLETDLPALKGAHLELLTQDGSVIASSTAGFNGLVDIEFVGSDTQLYLSTSSFGELYFGSGTVSLDPSNTSGVTYTANGAVPTGQNIHLGNLTKYVDQDGDEATHFTFVNQTTHLGDLVDKSGNFLGTHVERNDGEVYFQSHDGLVGDALVLVRISDGISQGNWAQLPLEVYQGEVRQTAGSDSDDLLNGTSANDVLAGNAGNDTLIGGAGADDLIGGLGVDLASYVDAYTRVNLDLRLRGTGGEAANDTFSSIENVEGSDFDDYVYGNSADNVIVGGDGNDRLRGHYGDDTLLGGSGDDNLIGGSGADRLEGGEGLDFASYLTASARVNLDLRYGGTAGDAAGDTFTSIENVLGSDFSDYIFGDDAGNLINGDDGNDRLRGDGGEDTLIGGAGADDLRGGSGNDEVNYAHARARVNLDLREQGTAGDALGDTFFSIENVVGSRFNDFIVGDGVANLIEGLAGDDRLRGGGGNDTLLGGAGADEMRGGSGVDEVNYTSATTRVNLDLRVQGTGGEAAGDTFTSIENVIGSDFGDYIYGSNVENVLSGDDGADRLRGHHGNDTLIGGTGDDNLIGGAGQDVFLFNDGDGADIVKDFQNNVDTVRLLDYGFADVAAALATATEVGSDIIFALGNGDFLTVENVTINQIANDLEVV